MSAIYGNHRNFVEWTAVRPRVTRGVEFPINYRNISFIQFIHHESVFCFFSQLACVVTSSVKLHASIIVQTDFEEFLKASPVPDLPKSHVNDNEQILYHLTFVRAARGHQEFHQWSIRTVISLEVH